MTTQRIEIRTPTLVVPTLHLRRLSAVVVLQLSARAPRAARPAASGGRSARLELAHERAEEQRTAVLRERLGTL